MNLRERCSFLVAMVGKSGKKIPINLAVKIPWIPNQDVYILIFFINNLKSPVMFI